jgi:hypothetical protein
MDWHDGLRFYVCVVEWMAFMEGVMILGDAGANDDASADPNADADTDTERR